jgi:aminoglycoside/choline kinase family phosphotransferase
MTRHFHWRLKIAEILQDQLLESAKDFDKGVIDIKPLKIEASGRRYYRALSRTNSYVMCHDDSPINGQSVFVDRSNKLANSNVRVPKILKYDSEKFLTIQEDIGDNSLILKENFYQDSSLVFNALSLLNDMHKAELNGIDSTFSIGLESHTKKFSKILCKEFLEIEIFDEFKDFLEAMRPELMNQQWGNCHFDFERRNIHEMANGELVLLDFQDLCFGPIGIDLAGILLDHYVDCDLEVLRNYCSTFSEISCYDLSADDVYHATCWGGLQRNLRIMGTLTNLFLRFNRPFRMKDLPQILANTITLSLALNQKPLAGFLQDQVAPELHKKLGSL